jgi:hypothetical protein
VRARPPAVSHLGNQARLRHFSARAASTHADLRVGAIDDPLEREADAVADRVMRMADPGVSVASVPMRVSRKCAACEETSAVAGLQRKESAPRPGRDQAPPIVHATLSSPGRPLDPAVRTFFEPRFGRDFGPVRVHSDSAAATSARSINAAAYTVGSHLVFGSGQFQPGNASGRRLIAHELAHVVQQSGGAAALSVQRAGECEGRNGYNCNGVRCTTPAGRSGTCTWGGVNIGCNCRDNSSDEPGPSSSMVPSWLAALLGAATLAAIAACFATGVCEFGAVVAGLGAATAAAVLALLRAAGITDSGPTASSDDGSTSDAQAS